MDNEEFKRRLSEVAEWRVPKAEFDGVSRRRLKSSKVKVTAPDEISCEQEFVERFGDLNPTKPLEVLEIKIKEFDCPDCHRVCTQGRVVESRLHTSNKINHWRRRCTECGFFQNPNTGAYDVPSGRSGIVWNEYMRVRGVKQRQQEREKNLELRTTDTDEKRVVENDVEKITYYGDFSKPDK